MELGTISTSGKPDAITINLNDLDYCKNPNCKQKYAHNHELVNLQFTINQIIVRMC